MPRFVPVAFVAIASVGACAPRDQPPASVREGVESSVEVRATDGLTLFARVVGTGPDTVIAWPGLFLYHDLRGNRDLIAGRTWIFLDPRNRGRSDATADSTRRTAADDMRDLEAVREALSLSRFALVGYSAYGRYAIGYSLQHPDRVTRVVQLGPIGPRADAQYPPDLLAGDEAQVPDPAALRGVMALVAESLHIKRPEEFCRRDQWVSRVRLIGNPADTARIRNDDVCGMPNEWPVNVARHFGYRFTQPPFAFDTTALAGLQTQVLTIHGTKDRNASYGGGVEWAWRLPNARLLTIPGAAHRSFAEQPDVVQGAIASFLSGNWPTGAAKPSGMTTP
jgi:proline iminopeptidase